MRDDDSAGEVADLVGITANDTDITVTLVHCKYSSEPSPGARVGDLYEVCGQAARGAKWREYGIDALLRTLDRRAGKYATRHPGKTPYLIGSIHEPYRIRERAPRLRPHINTVIAQPGLSAAANSSTSSPVPTPTSKPSPEAHSPSTAACRSSTNDSSLCPKHGDRQELHASDSTTRADAVVLDCTAVPWCQSLQGVRRRPPLMTHGVLAGKRSLSITTAVGCHASGGARAGTAISGNGQAG
ncbi:hypothetical protein GTX14_25460 [Streptomyces sp. SID4944]|nr:hypothetical protein [Streptomyces sp. SID4944]